MSDPTFATQGPRRQDVATLGLIAGYLFIVIVSWGSNYPLMKLALRDMPPLTFSAVRLFGGSVVVAVLLWSIGAARLLPPREERAGLGGVSILQYVSVLGLASVSLQYLPAGRTVAVIYSMPLWAAVFDALILKNRLSMVQCLGILTSLGGMMLFLNPAVIDWSDTGAVMGLAMTALAAACWGLGAVLYRTRQWTASMLSQTLWQLLVAGAVLVITAIWLEYPMTTRFTPALMLILLWNWLVPTALAVWAWTKVLSYLPGSIAGQFLMSTPFVGIALSAWIFDENLPVVFALSATLITLGGMLALVKRGPAKPSENAFEGKKDDA